MRLFATLLALLMLVTSCKFASIEGDEVGVIQRKPTIFSMFYKGGVDKNAAQPGTVTVAWTTQVLRFKTSPQVYKEVFDNIITDDNNPVDFDCYISIKIQSQFAPNLYSNFGENWYINNISPLARAIIRDKCSQYIMFDLAGNREVLENIENFMQDSLRNYCIVSNLPVSIIDVTMGQVTPPADVLKETERTAAEKQSSLTQKARSNSEIARAEAEKNKAIADKAYRTEMGMTITEYLELRAIEVEKEKVEIIKDKKDVTIVFTGNLPVSYPAK